MSDTEEGGRTLTREDTPATDRDGATERPRSGLTSPTISLWVGEECDRNSPEVSRHYFRQK